MISTLFVILGVCFGIIFILFLAAVLIWVVFFKAIRGTTANVKETVRLLKEPSKKVKERHIFYEEDGIKKEVVEKL